MVNELNQGWRHQGLHQHRATGHLAGQGQFGTLRTELRPGFLLTIIIAKGSRRRQETEAVLLLSQQGREGDSAREAEELPCLLPKGPHTSLFQFLLQTSLPRQHVPRRGRETRRKSCLQAPAQLSGVVLGKKACSEIYRVPNIDYPIDQNSTHLKKARLCPAYSSIFTSTRCLDSLCL